MKQKQDGKGVADYVAETEDDIAKLVSEKGAGGRGIHELPGDAAAHGVTPELARARAAEAAAKPQSEEE